jgi:hypothetical protein
MARSCKDFNCATELINPEIEETFDCLQIFYYLDTLKISKISLMTIIL